MNYRTYLSAALLIPLFSTATIAQPTGEAAELSPEELDAAFTAEDATRERAGWSDKIIDTGPADPLGDMSAEADLVIRGTVSEQKVVHDDSGTPFTHTTFTIQEVVAGQYTGNQITVVQEGGPSKNRPERVLILSHTHHFNPGEEELLFLELEPESPYPYRQVVIQKRFGVLNNKVFSENGRGMILTETEQPPGYRLSWSSDRNPHPRFSEFKIGPHQFSKQFTEKHEDLGPGEQRASMQKQGAGVGYQAGVDMGTLKKALNGQGG